MADNLPGRRIDREALDRIIQRAAELQAGEIDTTEALTEQELLKLGADVGIDGRHMRQALYEQTSVSPSEKGVVARWFGPGRVVAGRVVRGEKDAIEAELSHWMTEGEALTIKRRLPDRTVWERQRGFMAEVKRGFGMGGKQYVLARAGDVSVAVTPLESGLCHVEISADMKAMRGSAVIGSAVGGGTLGLAGVGTFALLTALGVIFPIPLVGLVPLAAGAGIPAIMSRVQKQRGAQMQLALEQVLDRLESGEIKPKHIGSGQPFMRLADEIRKAISDGLEGGKSKRLRP